MFASCFRSRPVSSLMPLNRLIHRTPFSRLTYRTSIRMASTIVGKSGRVYVQDKVLQHHREDHKLNIFKAKSGNESFVFKRVPRWFYDLSQHLAAEFAGSRRLRMHIDCNQEESILVYPYFTGTLLGLTQEDPDLPLAERKKILQSVGEAIQELHSKDWIHIDVKPDNILVNWTCDNEGNKAVTDVALGDFDIVFKSQGGEPRQTPYAIGNVMWRSPEGQTGKGVTKASEMFSFGLVCIYALGGGDFLLIHEYQELAKRGIPPEQEIVTRHFCYFGPVPEELFKYVDSEVWCSAFRAALETAEVAVKDQPKLRFEQWGKELGPQAQNLISGMTKLDPKARMTIDEVMAHPWWQKAT